MQELKPLKVELLQISKLTKEDIILIILLRLIKLIIKHGKKERESFKLPYLLATVPLLFLRTS